MGLAVSNDILSENSEVDIKIKELPEKYGIDLSEEALKNYGERVISKAQIESLRIKETAGEKLDTLKGLFGLKAEIDTSGVEKQAKKLEGAVEAGEIEAKEAFAKASEAMEQLGNSETGKKIKSITSEVKNEIEGTGVINWAIDKLKSFGGWISEFIAGILSFFKLGSLFGDKTEKAKEVADKALVPDKLREVKEKIKNPLNKIGEGLSKIIPNHPLINRNIESILNNPEIFSKKTLYKIENRIQKGEKVDIKMLKSILNVEEYQKLKDSLFNEDSKKALMLKAEENIVRKIGEEYKLNLNSEKREELVKLIRKKGLNTDYLELAENFSTGERIDGFDVLGATIGTGVQLALFSISLVTKGIIGAGDLVLNIKDTGVETVEIGLSSLGITGGMSFEKFEEQLEKMTESEKGLLLGIMYRKTGFFARIIGNIGALAGKYMVNLVTPTSVNSLKMMKDSAMGNINKQIDNFQLLSKAISGKEDEYLQSATEQLKKLSTNGKIIKILDEGLDVQKTKSKLLSLKSLAEVDKNIIEKIESFDGNDINKFRKIISNNMNNSPVSLEGKQKIASRIYPGYSQSINDLSKNIETIHNYQKAKVLGGDNWNKVSRTFAKHSEIMANLEISRNTDKLIFEGLKKDEILTKVGALKKFAQDFPDIFKHSFGGIAEIAFIGLSLGTKGGESFLKVLGQDMLYMSGLLGPIALTLSAGSYIDKETKDIQWFNVAQSGVGGVLLGMDTMSAISIFGTKGFTYEAWKKIGTDIVLRPITASGKAIIATGKLGVNIADIARGKGSFNIKEIGEKVLSKIKGKKGKTAIIIGALSLGIYSTIELSKVDLSEEFEELQQKGIIDEKGHILKKEEAKNYFLTELSDREKKAFVELIFMQQKELLQEEILVEPSSNLDFSVDDNKLLITGKNSNIGEWVISPKMIEYLNKLGLEVIFEEYKI